MPRRRQTLEVGEDDRHDRTRRFLGSRALGRLRRSRVLVVGAGAVGNEVAKNLALAGVGHLTIVDPDTVELSNLNRCIFFRPGDVGRKKVHAIRRALRTAAPEVSVEVHARPIQKAPDRVWETDAVALCVDNDLARYFVNARLLGSRPPIPVVNGAMGRTWAEVSVLVPGATACLVCLWSGDYLESVLGEEVRRECDEFFARSVGKFPSISVLTSLVGALSSVEVVKLLARDRRGFPPAIGKRIRYDIRTHELAVEEVVANPECVDAVCRARRKERQRSKGDERTERTDRDTR